MLSLMLGFGIVSRLATGFIADRAGGVATLLMGRRCKASRYCSIWGSTGWRRSTSSRRCSACSRRIVPSYAIIVANISRRARPAPASASSSWRRCSACAGRRMSGAIFDYTGSYRAAFANGLAGTCLNVMIATWLLLRNRTGWRSLEKRRMATGQGMTESPGNRASTQVSAIINAVAQRRVHGLPRSGRPGCIGGLPDSMKGEVHVFEAREGGKYRMSLTYQDPAHSRRGKTSGDTDTSRADSSNWCLTRRSWKSPHSNRGTRASPAT